MVGAVVWVISSGDSGEAEAEGKRASPKYLTKEELEARRRHMEITKKSLAKVPEKRTEPAASKPAPKAKAAPRTAAKGGAARPSAPKKRPVSRKAAKKQLDALDSLGNDIASQLK